MLVMCLLAKDIAYQFLCPFWLEIAWNKFYYGLKIINYFEIIY